MNKYSLINGDLINVPDGEYIVVNDLLKYLVTEWEHFDNPDPYYGDDYYTRCNAKADVLQDAIYEIKRNR